MIQEKIHVRNKEKRRGFAILGLALIFFAIVGAITVAGRVVDFGVSIFSDEGRKQEMEKVVYPLVMMDPAPMVKMDRADEKTIVLASLWYCLMNEDNTKYQTENGGILTVPATDVEAYCARLFGDYYKPEHQTVGDYETSYTYDKENNCYYVPIVTKTGYYSPEVESYYTQNDFYYVRVGCVAPGPIWSGNTSGEIQKGEPDKYMQYVLQWVDGRFIVVGINEDPETVNTQLPSSSSPQQQSSDSESSSQDGNA